MLLQKSPTRDARSSLPVKLFWTWGPGISVVKRRLRLNRLWYRPCGPRPVLSAHGAMPAICWGAWVGFLRRKRGTYCSLLLAVIRLVWMPFARCPVPVCGWANIRSPIVNLPALWRWMVTTAELIGAMQGGTGVRAFLIAKYRT